MELIFALAIFGGLLLINNWMDKKIKLNNSNDYIKSIARDPVSIVSHLRSELREIGLNVKQARLVGDGAMLAKYLREVMDLSRSAQLLAIDLEVLSLDIRGPLLKEYGGLKDVDFKLKYDEYKKEFLETGGIKVSFAKLMKLNGPAAFFMEVDVPNKIFIDLHLSARKFLNSANLMSK